MLEDELDTLLELALMVARLASMADDVVERPVLEVWFAVIPAFCVLTAVSVLAEEVARLFELCMSVVSDASNVAELFERFTLVAWQVVIAAL